ncbi:hypothetical protein IWW38_005238, partial [Coemansia aciculifera]
LRDIHDAEVVEGEMFSLHIQSSQGTNEDNYPEEDELNMYYGKDWLSVFHTTNYEGESESLVHGAMDEGSSFGATVVDGVTYITFEGQFLQIGDEDSGPPVVVLPEIPSEENRIQISYTDGGNLVLSQWGTDLPIICDWVKATYGATVLGDIDDAVYPHSLLRMHLIKV